MMPFEQTCTRIAEALEMLVAEEAVAVRSREFAAAAAIQERAAPLVEFLSVHAAHVSESRPVIERLRGRREESSRQLEQAIGRMRDDLCALEFSRRRLARMSPAYVQSRPTPPRLSVAG